MRRIVLFMIVLISAFSCDKYNDPATETVRNYHFSFETAQGNRFSAGSLVSDSIKFIVNSFALELNSTASREYTGMLDSFNVVFEVIKGGGKLTRQSAHTNKNRIAYTGWTLGNESCEQKLRAKAYDLNGKYLSFCDLTEYGFRTNQWDTFSGYPEGSMTSIAADTINKITLMVSGNSLYKQADTYYTWWGVYPGFWGITAVNVDKNGVFYVNNSGGNLYKSTDHGGSWLPCTSPFSDQVNNMSVYISNDNYIWVSSSDHYTRFSSDGGSTWNNAGNEVSFHGSGNFFRMKNGSILFHGSDCCSLYRSVNNGLSWTKLETPPSSVKVFVNEKDEILLCTQENGISIYRSIDNAASFSKVFSTIPNGLTAMDRTFTKWHNTYYVLIPGWGIFVSSDLVHYQEYWFNANLSNLFIDHNGVLIAKDKNGSTIYYFKN
jgi:hypothetical protein